MRTGTIKAFEAWMQGKSYRQSNRSIWTEGGIIYSYNTPILYVSAEGKAAFNTNRYSRTTSTHQNGLRALLHERNHGYNVTEVSLF